MRRRRVLVVEDDVASQSAIASLISTEGYEAVCADSAEDALKIAMSDGADVALVDRFLPGACGSSLVRWLRGSTLDHVRSMPVIGISTSKQSERDLVAAGAVCFLQKPLDGIRLKMALSWTASVYWDQGT